MSKVTWNLDPAHSELGFKVKHMMVANVSGHFSDFSVSATSEDEGFSNPEINFSAKTASVKTGQEPRDGHLQGADFFDSANHPEMTFTSTKMEKLGDDQFKLIGDLSIRGTKKTVSLDVEFGGIGKDPYGNTKAGFSISGKIKRSDFGLNWNAALEAGGVLVSDEVRINSEIQLVKA